MTSALERSLRVIYKAPWLFFVLLMLITNSVISFDHTLTRVSAMDTSIYLAIADASPGLPPPGSELVYHGAQRFIIPYSIGYIAKLTNQPSWDVFKSFVYVVIFLTSWVFWKTSRYLTNELYARVLIVSILCFHVYLFRLQVTFRMVVQSTHDS
jgi:hypothetical protein